MKVLVVLSIFICVVFSKIPYERMNDWQQLGDIYANECILESGANPVVAKNMFEDHKLVDEEHIRCYFKCLALKTEIMSEDGVFIEDEIVKKIPHVTPEIARKCVANVINETDVCRKAYLVALCATEENFETL